jgi:hypothetical protein
LHFPITVGAIHSGIPSSMEFGFGDVRTDAKPNDCDFIHAPLGDKGCDYKAHVKVYNADGVLVAGENAPKYGSDAKTAKPIISYDGGKNWDWYIGAAVPNPKPKSVKVFWVSRSSSRRFARCTVASFAAAVDELGDEVDARVNRPLAQRIEYTRPHFAMVPEPCRRDRLTDLI